MARSTPPEKSGAHAAGNPGEDSDVQDAPRYLTVGGSAEARAQDPHEDESVRWSPEEQSE